MSSLGSAELTRGGWKHERPLEEGSTYVRTRQNACPSLTITRDPSLPTLNAIVSAVFSPHRHNTNKIINIQNNQPIKTQLTLDHALLLITGKNNTDPLTLREKPTHKKTYNKYTHHLKIKREKELTLLFYIFCIQNKKHKENQKQREKKRKKRTPNM
jgi:hypothetical protein